MDERLADRTGRGYFHSGSHSVPAKGLGRDQGVPYPNPFHEDTWVRAIEVRPGNRIGRASRHGASPGRHAGSVVLVGSVAAACVAAPAALVQQDFNEGLPASIANRLNGSPPAPPVNPPKNFAILEAVYAPGTPPMDFGLYDSAKLIRGGGDLRIEVHYTPNGTATSDQTRIGFTLAKEPPQQPICHAGAEIARQGGDANTRGRSELGNSR